MHPSEIDEFLAAWRSASLPTQNPYASAPIIWRSQTPEHLRSQIKKYYAMLDEGEITIKVGRVGAQFKTAEDIQELAQEYWNVIWALQEALNEIEYTQLLLIARRA